MLAGTTLLVQTAHARGPLSAEWGAFPKSKLPDTRWQSGLPFELISTQEAPHKGWGRAAGERAPYGWMWA